MSDTNNKNEDKCIICMSSIKNKNYGFTDDPEDISAKCCVICIKQVALNSKISLIGRNPINSYTIYDPSGNPLETHMIIKNNNNNDNN